MLSLHQANVVLAGHGSRDPDGVAEFERFAQLFKDRYPEARINHGYLEFQKPTIAEAVEEQAAEARGPIVVVPALLAAATHAKNDVPSILNELRAKLPSTDIRFAAVMDLHASLLKLCQQRIAESESSSLEVVNRADTCLVVVGRGTSDPDANGDIAKLARMLQEGMSFGSSITCYSGTAKPLVADGLRAAAKLGYKRIIVLPYFLFDGVLVKRIYDAADALTTRMPEIEVLKAKYLGVDDVIADVFAERAHEALYGKPTMNCGLCKYRQPIVGFEKEAGLPQAPHTELAQKLLVPTIAVPITSKEFPKNVSSNGLYEPHPIEAQSFEIIDRSYDWNSVPEELRPVLKRLVHTTGDFDCVKDVFFSPGAVATGIRSLLRCRRVVTDVTMVQSGFKRALLQQLQIETWCGVHDEETVIIAERLGLTRSAAGIRRAWQKFGNDAVIAIGDAPTAVVETVRLVREHGWRPQLVIGIPVGFVGTAESKDTLKNCIQVPRITNSGTRGGSPWAATIVNAMLIQAINQVATYVNA